MKKHRAMVRLTILTCACALPYIVLPALDTLLPEMLLLPVTLFLCEWLPLLSAVLAPFFIARGGVPAIAAWPWPLLCTLILPLWGMRPGLFAIGVGALLSIVSAVAGEEWEKRRHAPKRR